MAKEITMSLRVDEEMKKALEAIAREEELSISYIIRKAIKQYVQKYEENK